MKTNFLLIAVVVAMLTSVTSFSQTPNDPKVKILPSADRDILKVLFVSEINEPVTVTFFKGSEIVATDKISGRSYSKGFLKKYDVGSINDKDFTIEVKSAHQSATYKVIPSISSGGFVAQLERLSSSTEFMVKRND
jgi:hypothetical protein